MQSTGSQIKYVNGEKKNDRSYNVKYNPNNQGKLYIKVRKTKLEKKIANTKVNHSVKIEKFTVTFLI